jgi:electron transport complex protein RnfG
MAKKLESSFKNMLLVLLVTTAFSALALSITYSATKESIEKAKEAKMKAAIEEVVSGFDELKGSVVTDDSGNEIKIFECLKEGELIGIAIESYSMLGFSGKIDIMIGFLPDGTITETVVLAHAETPGLGDKIDISKSNFPRQFWNKNIADLQTNGTIAVTKDGGKIDAITAATITSRAFCDAIDRAWERYQQNNNK